MTYFSFFPNLNDGVDVSFSHSTAIDRQKRGGEKRRSMGSHMLRSFGFKYLLDDDVSQDAREWFDSDGADLVTLPDWTCGHPVESVSEDGNTVTLKAGQLPDFRCHEVYILDSKFGLRAGEWIEVVSLVGNVLTLAEVPVGFSTDIIKCATVYPGRVGRIKKKPNFEEKSDALVSFSVDFAETVESLNEAITWHVSDEFPDFSTRKVFNLYHQTKSSSWQGNVSYSKNGYGVDTPYQREDEPKRTVSLSVTSGTREDVYGLINFFDSHSGRAEGFWLPSREANYRLSSDALAGEVSVTINSDRLLSNQVKRRGYSHIALRCWGNLYTGKVTAVTDNGDGTQTLALDSALDHDFPADKVAVQLLLYVRFSADELKLKFKRDSWAEGSVGFIELPYEYQEQETGTRPIYLYEISGYWNAKLTSYGKSVVVDGVEYERADINHGALSYKAESLQSNLTVSFGTEDVDHPLKVFQRGYPVEPMTVKVYKTSASDAQLGNVFYSAAVRSMSYSKKNKMSLKLGSVGDFAETEVPTAWAEARCSRAFGAEGCFVDLEAYRYDGVLDVVTDLSVTVTGANAEAAVRGFADWFSHGRIRIGDELRTVTKQDGDVIYVSSPFLNVDSGAAVVIYPGCNRTLAACRDRFNNLNNYGGCPSVPTTNPQLDAITYNSALPSGGKK